MNHYLNWDINKNTYGYEELGKLGKWVVFKIRWDDLMPKGETENTPYKLTAFLAGIKENLGSFQKVEKAKECAEEAARYWLSKTGIKFEEIDGADDG